MESDPGENTVNGKMKIGSRGGQMSTPQPPLLLPLLPRHSPACSPCFFCLVILLLVLPASFVSSVSYLFSLLLLSRHSSACSPCFFCLVILLLVLHAAELTLCG